MKYISVEQFFSPFAMPVDASDASETLYFFSLTFSTPVGSRQEGFLKLPTRTFQRHLRTNVIVSIVQARRCRCLPAWLRMFAQPSKQKDTAKIPLIKNNNQSNQRAYIIQKFAGNMVNLSEEIWKK